MIIVAYPTGHPHERQIVLPLNLFLSCLWMMRCAPTKWDGRTEDLTLTRPIAISLTLRACPNTWQLTFTCAQHVMPLDPVFTHLWCQVVPSTTKNDWSSLCIINSSSFIRKLRRVMKLVLTIGLPLHHANWPALPAQQLLSFKLNIRADSSGSIRSCCATGPEAMRYCTGGCAWF